MIMATALDDIYTGKICMTIQNIKILMCINFNCITGSSSQQCYDCIIVCSIMSYPGRTAIASMQCAHSATKH